MILRAFCKKDLPEIRALYREAFPLKERAPYALLTRRALQGRGTLLVAVDQGVFCGFFYVLEDPSIAYIFYFAVAKAQRGCGRGSEMLALLQRYCAGKRLFLALEAPDETASNAEQRRRRWQFYERNGFSPLPGHIKEGSVVFKVMGIGGVVHAEDYDRLVRQWCGNVYQRLIDLKFID